MAEKNEATVSISAKDRIQRSQKLMMGQLQAYRNESRSDGPFVYTMARERYRLLRPKGDG